MQIKVTNKKAYILLNTISDMQQLGSLTNAVKTSNDAEQSETYFSL